MKKMSHLRKVLIGAGGAMACAMLVSIAGAAEGKVEKAKPYPLKTCVVSGEKLGGMGTPHVITYQGREIKFCCKGCVKGFNQEPAKYIKKLEEAEKAAKDGKQPGAPATGHGKPQL